jgi:hypothetical protein
VQVRWAICMLLGVAAIGFPTGPCRSETIDLVPAVDVSTWPDAPFRWKDIATNLYAQAYRDTYRYEEAEVTVTFEAFQDSAYAGHLSGSHLKPNFAYQVKLVGKPEALWGPDGDDATNERIGYTGRWWRVTPNPGNATDQDYEAHRDDPEYIYEGYLLFDFFVTDRFGDAELDFATESSYHVLWWEGQRTRGTCDSPVLESTVVGQASDPAYDQDIGPVDIGVYAEIERLCYGEMGLGAGHYNCRFFLTEESFHQSGENEGNWLSVLVCDTLTFDLRGFAGAAAAHGGPLDLGPPSPNPFTRETRVEFRLREEAAVDLAVYDAAGKRVADLVCGRMPRGYHAARWNGETGSGRRASPGVYFCRLSADGRVSLRKIVLVD